jgi:hypothetical protein
MEATATTLVTALINEARAQYGTIAAVEVPEDLLDKVMDEVVSAGGEVGFDSCQVDGVTVVALAADTTEPRVRLAGAGESLPLRPGT